MTFGGTCFYYSVRFITSIAFCGFCAVLSAGCVIVRNVIRKTMPERITACKSFRSFFAATARIVIFRRLCTGCRRSKVFFDSNFLIERMRKFAALVRYGVCHAATVTFCGFCAVLSASCIIVRNVICKTMPERITACKSFRSFLATRTRIIIGCFFGAGCVGRFIFVRYDLFVKRMNMLIFFTTG